MTPLIFTTPAAFSNRLLYERFGAIIKERATGQIVAHLQETGTWGLLRHVPIPGGNPLQLVTEGIQMAQLARIQETLTTVQTLATVGAVASVASLGVCAAGFAVVLSKLKRMEGKLDAVLAQTAEIRRLVERLDVKADALTLAVLSSELEAVSLAWRYDHDRQRQSLQQSIRALSRLRHYYASLLANEDFCLQGTQGLPALLDTHERFVAVCEGELYAEFLLSGGGPVLDERWNVQQNAFHKVAWRSPEELFDLAEQGDRDSGVFMVTRPDERRSKVAMVAQVRDESLARLESLPALGRCLNSRGVSGIEYLQDLREHISDDDVVIAMDARD